MLWLVNARPRELEAKWEIPGKRGRKFSFRPVAGLAGLDRTDGFQVQLVRRAAGVVSRTGLGYAAQRRRDGS